MLDDKYKTATNYLLLLFFLLGRMACRILGTSVFLASRRSSIRLFCNASAVPSFKVTIRGTVEDAQVKSVANQVKGLLIKITGELVHVAIKSEEAQNGAGEETNRDQFTEQSDGMSFSLAERDFIPQAKVFARSPSKSI